VLAAFPARTPLIAQVLSAVGVNRRLIAVAEAPLAIMWSRCLGDRYGCLPELLMYLTAPSMPRNAHRHVLQSAQDPCGGSAGADWRDLITVRLPLAFSR
jgi:hypothetical protein